MCSNDLSLGFNAGAAHPNHHHHPMWHPLPSTTSFPNHPYADPNSLFTADAHPVNVASANAHLKSTWVPAAAGATVACQDCGNQAKKDCGHSRCRTCCRNRGFDCSTHVRSTWVSAAGRRERQATAGDGGASSGSSSGAKKPRTVPSQTTTAATTPHTSASNTPARSFDTSSSHQDACFKETLPGQVRAPAVFRCVRVTAVDDGDDEFAYQAVVKIGGHVFKGFLYDQGADQSRIDGCLNLSELHLGGRGGDGRVGRNGASSSSSPLLDPSVVYGGSGGGLLGGSSYANTLD